MLRYVALLVVIALAAALFFGKTVEGLEMQYTNNGENRCPNLLIQRGAKFFLYNTRIAEVPGVNPVEFNHLDDYVEFLQWQRSVGIRCPVLYLQQVYTADGKRVYKTRPSVTELEDGLPPIGPQPVAINDTDLYDQNPMAIPPEQPPTSGCSPDAMDPNWCGPEATQQMVNNGFSKGQSREENVQ
jgi:hypothetical protein